MARETVKREAREQDVSLEHHVQHLVVHGILHLLGYDHTTTADAERMEALEIKILSELGVANPYTGALETGTSD
jgi:probable rRNA maturation factor